MDPLDPLFDDADYDAALARDNRERELRLWGAGSLFKAKRLLQRRGYGVWWKCRARGLIHCGGLIVSRRKLFMLAARERRLTA